MVILFISLKHFSVLQKYTSPMDCIKFQLSKLESIGFHYKHKPHKKTRGERGGNYPNKKKYIELSCSIWCFNSRTLIPHLFLNWIHYASQQPRELTCRCPIQEEWATNSGTNCKPRMLVCNPLSVIKLLKTILAPPYHHIPICQALT